MATYPMDVRLVQEAQERASRQIVDLLKTLVKLNTGSGGETFGMQEMSRGDRILMFLDDAESGALDMLFTVNRDFGQQYVDAFMEDLQKTPMYQRDGRTREAVSKAVTLSTSNLMGVM